MRTCILIALLCYATHIPAQLSIGDQVPDIAFENVLNHEKQKFRLSDFRDKVIILDFWATWCTSCLHSFPKLDSLQKKYGNDLQVILVNTSKTRDDEKKVKTFLSKWEKQQGKLGLPLVVNDSTAGNLFPHRLLPHYAWISREGRLVATTSSGAITEENIRRAIRYDRFPGAMKKDQDAGKPIFTTGDLPFDKLLHYAMLVRGRFDGLPGGERTRTRNGMAIGKAFTNTPLVNMYQKAAYLLDPSVYNRRFIVEGIDSAELFAPMDLRAREGWYEDHLYSLDVLVPEDSAGRLYQHLVAALNNYSPYAGTFENRNIPCLVLERAEGFDKIISEGGRTENWLSGKQIPYLKNGKMELLLRSLNRLSFIDAPVLDGTGYEALVNISFRDNPHDLKSLSIQLAKNGLKLVERIMPVKVFVLRKKN